MPRATLAPVLQQLRRLTATPAGTSDTELLQQFAACRDEAAFTALVQRHGRLVLSVCRRVLGHEQDAEDAFQATFLVLARKAGTIRQREALAGWLHGVAYNLAMKTRRAAARRRAHERQQAARRQPAGAELPDITWRELQTVLDEEVQRLPEKYRAPFVLCCLDGRTKAEAARQLGWKEGTVGGRLSRAREQLRMRLLRRGVSLAAVLGLLSLQQTSGAAIPALLTTATARAALGFAAGQSLAEGLVSANAVALSKSALTGLWIAKLRTVTMLLVAVGLLTTGAGVLTYEAIADRPNGAAAPPAAPAANVPAGPAKNDDRRAVTGQVLDAQGQPLANAPVALVGYLRLPLSDDREMTSGRTNWLLTDEMRVLDSGQSDAEGRYQLSVPRDASNRFHSAKVAAGGAGHGLNWQALDLDAKELTATIRLEREQVRDVRLIDLNGQPAAGVRVDVAYAGDLTITPDRQYTLDATRANTGPVFYQAWDRRDRRLRDAEVDEVKAIQPAKPDDVPFWPKTMTADDKGGLQIRGLGRNHPVGLLTRDPRFALQVLEVNPAEQGKPVTLALPPARTLEGTVAEEGTGRPLPHSRLVVHSFPSQLGGVMSGPDAADWNGSHIGKIHFIARGATIRRLDAQADAKGWFRINPWLGDNFLVTAFPPEVEACNSLRKTVAWQKGSIKQEVNLALPRGQRIRGQVVEAATGKRVAAARVDFWPKGFQVPQPILYDQSVSTGPDGTFQAVLPAGQWLALANAPRSTYLWQKIAIEQVHGSVPRGIKNWLLLQHVVEATPNYRPDAWTAIVLMPGAPEFDLLFALRRLTLTGRIVGPEGKPVADARVFRRAGKGWMDRFANATVRDGRFEFAVRDADDSYSFMVFDAKNNAGLAATFTGKDAEKPVDLRLESCGSATVRFLDDKKQPLANYRPLVWLLLPPGPHSCANDANLKENIRLGLHDDTDAVWLGRADPKSYGAGPRADADAKVTLPGLIPGATYRISQFGGKCIDFTAAAGKTVALGDIIIGDSAATEKLPTVK